MHRIARLVVLLATCGVIAACSSNGNLSSDVGACASPFLECNAQCTDSRYDPANCGACGNACADQEFCQQGTCVSTCGSGDSQCAGACVDLARDPLHCGDCATACSAGESCDAGHCALHCASPLAVCGSACVDPRNDPANCGACGKQCDAGLVCSNGACVVSCADGLTQCGQSCKDTSVDRANCGACGTACRADQVCSAGSCACAQGATDCGETCVDLTADPKHCGTCDVACDANLVCAGGKCGAYCTGGLTACGDTCKDMMDDPSNCGACGNACTGGTVCNGGKCACPAGSTDCGGACVDVSADTKNCGACGVACETCSDGECLCPLGRDILCDGVCVDPLTDGQNCGGCGRPCAKCVDGQCNITAVAIAAGYGFSCALLSDNSMKCWGGDEVLRGSAETGDVDRPVANLTTLAGNVTQFVAGADEMCVILDATPDHAGTLECWGHGAGCFPEASTPTARAAAYEVKMAEYGLCIRNDADEIVCGGQVLYNIYANKTGPGPFYPTILDIPRSGASFPPWSIGDTLACYIEDGQVYCAGEGLHGSDTFPPKAIDGFTDDADVAVSCGSFCARSIAGDVQCATEFGPNTDVGPFDALYALSSAPSPFTASWCGIQYAPGASAGTASCWSIESSVGTSTPQALSLPPVTSIAIAFDHTCFLDSGGQVWCMGHNGAGQLGNGTTTDSMNTPVKVLW